MSMPESASCTAAYSVRNILDSSKVPLLLKNRADKWNITKTWTLEDWGQNIGFSKLLPFRCGQNFHTEEPQWESLCVKKDLTMRQFIDHCLSNDVSAEWLYFDYKHLNEWFQDNEDFLKDIDWGIVGFPERKKSDSTLWIGSKGAHTPCHVDTYGFNLIAQIYGQKQWFLFPPESGEILKATRVPYEESSIYSQINFFSPSEVESLDAYVVTLDPGDVLLVPNGWWHYVETISEAAISLNTWVPLASDAHKQLEEALVKLFVSSVCRLSSNASKILNPNESNLEDENILNYIQWATEASKKLSLDEKPPAAKRACLDLNELPEGISRLKIFPADQFRKILRLKRKNISKRSSTILQNDTDFELSRRLINAMCSQQVLATIASKITNE
ncbi:HSPB1-associated protein 1 [Neocloeon triangulifer]|uniref:HSPB1-associated protein 1 n=1 Tax=Neocloeon triangulifer TaxID=2078957 RepID=UPI00286F8D4B|nr:HSPB1-associated protein 1 [Neocloeon triangulifer]XP_059486652.1 HSPB1-associated protein 1 [Neocloeon triangulifer]